MSQANPTPILPPRQTEERPLFVIMAIMAFLSGLTLILVLLGFRISSHWQNDLSRSITVQVYVDPDADPEQEIQKALEAIRSIDQLRAVWPMDKTRNQALLQPWLGDVELPEDLPVPQLIVIEQHDNVRLDINSIKDRLKAVNIEADIDDHSRWSKQIARSWVRVQLALTCLLALMIGSTIAIASYATQSVIRARQNIILVLEQVGASRRFVSGLFIKRFMALGIKASVTGIVLAIAFSLFFLLWHNTDASENSFKIELRISDLAFLGLLCLVMGLISSFTAGYMSQKIIQRLQRRL